MRIFVWLCFKMEYARTLPFTIFLMMLCSLRVKGSSLATKVRAPLGGAASFQLPSPKECGRSNLSDPTGTVIFEVTKPGNRVLSWAATEGKTDYTNDDPYINFTINSVNINDVGVYVYRPTFTNANCSRTYSLEIFKPTETTISPTDPATNYSIPTPTATDVHSNGHWPVVIGIGIGIVAAVVVIVIIVCCVKYRSQNQGTDARSKNIADNTGSSTHNEEETEDHYESIRDEDLHSSDRTTEALLPQSNEYVALARDAAYGDNTYSDGSGGANDEASEQRSSNAGSDSNSDNLPAVLYHNETDSGTGTNADTYGACALLDDEQIMPSLPFNVVVYAKEKSVVSNKDKSVRCSNDEGNISPDDRKTPLNGSDSDICSGEQASGSPVLRSAAQHGGKSVIISSDECNATFLNRTGEGTKSVICGSDDCSATLDNRMTGRNATESVLLSSEECRLSMEKETDKKK